MEELHNTKKQNDEYAKTLKENLTQPFFNTNNINHQCDGLYIKGGKDGKLWVKMWGDDNLKQDLIEGGVELLTSGGFDKMVFDAQCENIEASTMNDEITNKNHI